MTIKSADDLLKYLTIRKVMAEKGTDSYSRGMLFAFGESIRAIEALINSVVACALQVNKSQENPKSE